jgi:hypothetical protein
MDATVATVAEVLLVAVCLLIDIVVVVVPVPTVPLLKVVAITLEELIFLVIVAGNIVLSILFPLAPVNAKLEGVALVPLIVEPVGKTLEDPIVTCCINQVNK